MALSATPTTRRSVTTMYEFLPLEELPEQLQAIPDPPKGLWVRVRPDLVGDLKETLAASTCVAVVGARSCTDYGIHVASKLSSELAEAGVVVVSGLARGVDSWAHRGAIDAIDGRTIAVLGCGIDYDYPHVHVALASEIVAKGGLIVSEYEPGVPPAPWRFPARNRIIAGLSQAVVVVEARERSGALITANFALDQGRQVLAVPGEITSMLSRGSNQLIAQGATPLLGVASVLDTLVWFGPTVVQS